MRWGGPGFVPGVVGIVGADWEWNRRAAVAVKIRGKRRDERVEQILRDPKAYFSRARENARAEVEAEMAQGRGRLRRRPA